MVLKENVIVGRLIPAGTGLAHHNARKKAKAMGPEAVALQAESRKRVSRLEFAGRSTYDLTEQPADAA